MTTGYETGGVDLDNIFAPRGTLSARSDVQYSVAGVDLSNRFADVSFGSGADNATGYRITGGADLQNVFAKIGSLVLELAVSANEWSYNVYDEAVASVGVGNIPPLVHVHVASTGRIGRLISGSLPVGTTWKLTLDAGAYVVGFRGQGSVNSGAQAEDGGAAISSTSDLEIINFGTIAGGGGGGSGGQDSAFNDGDDYGGPGGDGAGMGPNPLPLLLAGEDGSSGLWGGVPTAAGGIGGALQFNVGTDGADGVTNPGGGGGGGGGFAANGGAGGASMSQTTQVRTPGGSAGNAIEMNGNALTQTTPGDIFGSIVS